MMAIATEDTPGVGAVVVDAKATVLNPRAAGLVGAQGEVVEGD